MNTKILIIFLIAFLISTNFVNASSSCRANASSQISSSLGTSTSFSCDGQSELYSSSQSNGNVYGICRCLDGDDRQCIVTANAKLTIPCNCGGGKMNKELSVNGRCICDC